MIGYVWTGYASGGTPRVLYRLSCYTFKLEEMLFKITIKICSIFSELVKSFHTVLKTIRNQLSVVKVETYSISLLFLWNNLTFTRVYLDINLMSVPFMSVIPFSLGHVSFEIKCRQKHLKFIYQLKLSCLNRSK